MLKAEIRLEEESVRGKKFVNLSTVPKVCTFFFPSFLFLSLSNSRLTSSCIYSSSKSVRMYWSMLTRKRCKKSVSKCCKKTDKQVRVFLFGTFIVFNSFSVQILRECSICSVEQIILSLCWTLSKSMSLLMDLNKSKASPRQRWKYYSLLAFFSNASTQN